MQKPERRKVKRKVGQGAEKYVYPPIPDSFIRYMAVSALLSRVSTSSPSLG